MFKLVERAKSFRLPKSLALLLGITTAAVVLPAHSFAQSDPTVYVDDASLQKAEGKMAKGCRLKRDSFPGKTTGSFLHAHPSVQAAPMSNSHYEDLKKKWEQLPFCKIPSELPSNPPFSLGVGSPAEADINNKLRLIREAGDACDAKALTAAKSALVTYVTSPPLGSPLALGVSPESRDQLDAWLEQIEQWTPDCLKTLKQIEQQYYPPRTPHAPEKKGAHAPTPKPAAEPQRPTLVERWNGSAWTVAVAGGVTTGHRDGSLDFIDVISDETASTGQSGSSTFGTFGVLSTVSMPIFLPGLPGSQGFLETGFLFHTDNHVTASFTNFSGNEATGQTSTQENWSVPLLAGIEFPVSNLGIPAPNLLLQLKGGGMIDNRKASFSTFEVLPDLTTSASVTKTQFNPAVGFGLLYVPPASPFEFGVQTIFDFQQPINFTVQSMPFPSAFYNVNTGHQLNTTVLFHAGFKIAENENIRPQDRVFLPFNFFSNPPPPPR